jgi:hypothetical protein
MIANAIGAIDVTIPIIYKLFKFLKLELGYELNLIDSWYLLITIRRLIKNNKDYENEFAIKASKPF